MIIDRGKVIESGPPREVVARLGAEAVIELQFADGAGSATLDDDLLRAIPGVQTMRREPGALMLTTTAVQTTVGALLGLLKDRGIALEDLRTHRPTLEDVFVTLTGKHLRDA